MQQSEQGVIVRNRKASFEYEILDTFEAGIALKGRSKIDAGWKD